MGIKTLRDNENFFRIMLDAYPAMIFILNTDFVIVDYNKAAENALNKAGELILLQTGGEVFNCVFKKDHPKGCGYGSQCKTCKVRGAVTSAFNGIDVHRQKTRILIEKNDRQEKFHSLITTTKFEFENDTYVILTIEDNNNVVLQEQALRKQNLFLQTLIDTIPNPIFYKDNDGYYLGVNKTFEEALGIKKENIVGKTVFDMYPRNLAEEYHSKDLELINNPGMQSYEFQAKFADEKLHDVIYFKSTYHNETDEVEGIIGLFVDITERKQNERNLEKYSRELAQANKTKDKFFSLIAHDLRNPLNYILNTSELLQNNIDNLDKASIKDEVNDITESSKHVAKLLENLLQWARATSGNINFSPLTFDLFEIAFSVVSMMQNQAAIKSTKIENKIKPETLVFADYNMIETVLRNLVSNAIKYTENGRIIIESNLGNDDHISISVSDTGIGIDDKTQENLFSLERSYTSSGTRQESGSGLGLILTKEFIDINKGRIYAESSLGKGSKFTFTLPISKE